MEFQILTDYEQPEIHEVNKFVTLAIYKPSRFPTNNDIIVEVHSNKSNSSVMLYYNTLVTIIDTVALVKNSTLIDNLINTSKKLNKKGFVGKKKQKKKK